MVDSYATLLFAKITEIKPDEFCKQYGLCRDVSFLSVAKGESTCAFCHHLVDEVLSKMRDPDAQVTTLLHWHNRCPDLILPSLNICLVMSVVWNNSTSHQGVQQGSRSCAGGKLFFPTYMVYDSLDLFYTNHAICRLLCIKEPLSAPWSNAQ